MIKRIFHIAVAVCLVGGFSACGGDSADDLEEEKQKLAEKEARLDRLEELQTKRGNGTITPEEEVELHNLYQELEDAGAEPEGE